MGALISTSLLGRHRFDRRDDGVNWRQAISERNYLGSLCAGAGVLVTRLDGTLDWAHLAGLLAKVRV